MVGFIVMMLIVSTYAAEVVDLAGSVDAYECFMENGVRHVIVRAYHSYGKIDTEAQKNVGLANAAGLSTDVYMFPCRGKDPATQVDELLTYMRSWQGVESKFEYTTGTIWLDVETNPSPGCSWALGSFQSNCEFMQQLVDALKQNGRTVGIYASHYMWIQIFGSASYCTDLNDLPLWYAHYDNKQTFDDYNTNPFGGWTSPTLKQYAGDSHLCGYEIDLSYY